MKIKRCFFIVIVLVFVINAYSQSEYSIDIQHYGLEEGLKSLPIKRVLKDRHGVLWLSGGSGINRFDGRDFLTFTKTNNKLPFQGIQYMEEDEEGYLWLLKPCKRTADCTGKLAFFNPITHKVLSVKERFGTTFPVDVKELRSLKINNQRIIFRTESETYKWSKKDGFQQIDLPNFNKNKLIFQSSNGLTWDLQDQKYTISHSDKGLIYDLKKEYPAFQQKLNINDLLFDEYGTAWIGTEYGLFSIQIKEKPFQSILYTSADDIFLPQTIKVYDITRSPDGVLMFSAKEGIYFEKNGATSKLSIDVRKDPVIFCEDFYNGQLLMANQKGWYLLSNHNNTPLFTAFPDEIVIKNVKSLKIVNENQLWIGTLKGVYLLDLLTKEIEELPQINEFKEFKTAIIYHLFEKEENIWISTNLGIYQYHKEKGIIKRFYKDAKEHYLPGHIYYHLFEAKDQTIWLGTQLGLVKWELGTANHKFFPTSPEKTIGRVYCIHEDQNGNLWWSTRKRGIVQFFTKEKTSIGYTVRDGLPYHAYITNSSWQDENGRIYFGSPNGVATFQPKDFPAIDESKKEDLVILEYKQFSQKNKQLSLQTGVLLQKKRIVLKPNDGFFSIKVSFQNYANAKQFRYRYKVKGLNDVWIDGYENVISISDLPYGNYTLEIQGYLSNDGQTSNTLSIPVIVVKPFYLKWWFIIGISILLLISGYLAYHWQIRRLTTRQQELEKAVEERTAQIEKDKTIIEQDKLVISQQAEELRELDHLKSRFFANVSHELRTPLTLMLAPIENALKSQELTNKVFTNLLIAQRNGKRLNKMINEILDLTKLEAGKLAVFPENIVLYNFLRTIVANFESLANRKQIHFKFLYEENKTLQVELDKNKIETILVNLLSNAFKFTAKNGNITFTAKSDGQFLIFQVADTGQGIHSEDLPYIFDRFYQTKVNQAAQGGTGIGLALSKEFAKLLNGKISVNSQINKGTTFSVNIPKVEIISQISTKEALSINHQKQEQQQSETVETFLASKTSTENDEIKHTILLVEDNIDLRIFMQNLLSTHYHIITAENGQEALEQLSNIKINTKNSGANREPSSVNRVPSLIISDIMMPIMDGYTLLEKLKSDQSWHQIPVIMVTARATKDDRLKALRIGVDDYLLKPFDEDELKVRIENLIKNASNRQTISIEEKTIKVEEANETLPEISEKDQLWLQVLEEIILSKLSYFDFSVNDLAQSLTTNRWQLNTKIKLLTGLTSQQYIQEVRLNQARHLLESGEATTVKAATLAVGVKSIKYFSRQFKERFGKSPSEYIR